MKRIILGLALLFVVGLVANTTVTHGHLGQNMTKRPSSDVMHVSWPKVPVGHLKSNASDGQYANPNAPKCSTTVTTTGSQTQTTSPQSTTTSGQTQVTHSSGGKYGASTQTQTTSGQTQTQGSQTQTTGPQTQTSTQCSVPSSGSSSSFSMPHMP